LSVRVVSDLSMHVPSIMTDNVRRGEIAKTEH
jgi:hypothetical protein